MGGSAGTLAAGAGGGVAGTVGMGGAGVTRDAAATDSVSGDAQGALDAATSDRATCPSAVPVDPKTDQRRSCAFKSGAMPKDTIGISESQRQAIPIRHIIVVMKENRSYDEYFGQLYLHGQPESEPEPSGFSNPDSNGKPVAAYHETTTCVSTDPDHSWQGLHAAVDGGKMDGFVKASGAVTMGYYDDRDLPFYYFLASTFALADHHFASVLGPTFPNRDYLLLGTSDAIQCTCSSYPSSTLPSIMDLLEKKGLSWGAYSEQNDPFENTLGSGWRAAHAYGVHDVAEFKLALQNGTLPAVSFVDSKENINDEHPRADVQLGEAWTRDIYQAVVTSSVWPTTAMIWTYDEAGGFADHVPPPTTCVAAPSQSAFFELGVRIPLVVISPWARRRYVSHAVHEHTSITRFIETVFDLPALTARDANSDALLDLFDFSCPPSVAVPDPPPAGTGGCK